MKTVRTFVLGGERHVKKCTTFFPRNEHVVLDVESSADFTSARETLLQSASAPYDLIVLRTFPDENPVALVKELRAQNITTPVLVAASQNEARFRAQHGDYEGLGITVCTAAARPQDFLSAVLQTLGISGPQQAQGVG